MLRVVHISDTHGDEIEVPDGDILIHSGDAMAYGTFNDLTKFNAWMGRLPHKHKIYVPGNHDTIVEEDLEFCRNALTNVTLLKDSGVSLAGLKIWGTPWTPEFGRWAFMLPESMLKLMYDAIPNGLDILVCHGPPHRILDQVRYGHAGSRALLQAVQRAKPRYCLFGHIHEGHGTHEENGTIFMNSSINTVHYDPTQKPHCFQIVPGGASASSETPVPESTKTPAT